MVSDSVHTSILKIRKVTWYQRREDTFALLLYMTTEVTLQAQLTSQNSTRFQAHRTSRKDGQLSRRMISNLVFH